MNGSHLVNTILRGSLAGKECRAALEQLAHLGDFDVALDADGGNAQVPARMNHEGAEAVDCFAHRHGTRADASRDLSDSELVAGSEITAHETVGDCIEHLSVESASPTAQYTFA